MRKMMRNIANYTCNVFKNFIATRTVKNRTCNYVIEHCDKQKENDFYIFRNTEIVFNLFSI